MSLNTLLASCVYLLLSVPSFSQAAFDKEQVSAEAKAQLDAMASSDKSDLKEFCTKNEITGTYVFDMTIQGKGAVLTVFMVSQEPANINQKNQLKDKLHTLRFENIKLPKNERVKFRHTLQF